MNKIKNIKIELNLGDIACFVKPHTDFVCDTIVRGILPKRHNGLESPSMKINNASNVFHKPIFLLSIKKEVVSY